MKFSKLTAAILAAAIVVTPLSVKSPGLLTPSKVFAEGTGVSAALPDWIPTDFDSAVHFRNTYGATHIDNGLICIVLLNEYCIPANNVLRYDTVTTKNALDTVSRKVYSSDMTKTKLEVIVYKPLVQGDIEVDIIDIMLQAPSLDLGYHHASGYYTFAVDNNFNITETDIFSWLPDCKEEYNEYTKLNGEVSVKDNYVVFCTMAVDQFGDKWEPASTNKYENIKDILSSDCTMQLPELYDDGSVDKIYVYQAVKDGYEKISWTRTSNMRPNQSEPTTYTLTADCAVIDDAQAVLLNDQTRVTVIDAETEVPVPDEALKADPFKFHADIIYTPNLYSSLNGNDANYTITNNRSILEECYLCSELSSLAMAYNKADLFKITTEEPPEIIYYDNNAMDIIFKISKPPLGDLNGDKIFSISDLVLLQRWLLGVSDVKIMDWSLVDFNKDNQLDIFDLVLMRKALLKSIELPVEVSVEEGGGGAGAKIIYKVYSEGENYFLSYQNLTFDQEPKSIVKQISEQEYREIMAQDYDSMIRFMEDPDRPGWSEIVFVLELSYSDGSQKNAVSDRMPSVLTKLRDLLAKSFDYVEPDKRIEYGPTYDVLGDGVKLYSGPDESYEVIDNVPSWTKLKELGYQNGNGPWIFTEYCGHYGWVNSSDSNISVYLGAQWGKPVIYIYPEKETDVHVELELTTSDLYTTYPRYNNGWDVTAYPDGSLLNKADGTHHKYLFWESVNARTGFDFSKGFCVAGSDTESFLKEKLTYMGLTEEEMNEFIVYWLPKMEHNKYNLIAFQGEVYTNSAKLSITPTPDSLLRIFMTYVPLEKAVDIEPQQLETFERKGFTVVEWGGSEIKS